MRLSWPRHFLDLPLHPMLVHFPLAFWLCVPVFDSAALIRDAHFAWPLALIFTGAGVLIGAMALVSGLLDYLHLSETGSNDVRLAARHGVRTTVVWSAMGLKLVFAALVEPGPALFGGALVFDLLVCALLLQGAFFGTKITYGRYGR